MSKARLLIVEDDHDISNMLRIYFSGQNYEVDIAPRGAIALEKTRQNLPNLIVGDYVTLPEGYWLGSPYDALGIDRSVRDWIEHNNSQTTAQRIAERLPNSREEMERLLARGSEVAHAMSWDVVARDYLVPVLRCAQSSYKRAQALPSNA